MNEPRCRSAAGAHEAGPGGRAPASPVPPSHTPLNTIALTSPTQRRVQLHSPVRPRARCAPTAAPHGVRPTPQSPAPQSSSAAATSGTPLIFTGRTSRVPPPGSQMFAPGSREERPELRGVSGGVHTFPEELPAPGHGLTPSASANKSARFKAISQNLLNAQNSLKLSSVLGNHEC